MAESVRQQVFHFDWGQSEPLHALLCLPAVALPLLLGPQLGYTGTGVLMAGGAMCVGFGSFQRPIFSRWGPMLIAAVGIAISAGLGTMFRDHRLIFGSLVVLWAFMYGLANAIGPATGWVGLQCCIYLVVSAAAPARPQPLPLMFHEGLLRASGMLAGGLLQFVIILLLWRFVRRAGSNLTDPDAGPERADPRLFLQQIDARTPWFHFALRMAATAVVAVLVRNWLQFNNAYWVTMTALMVPKPEFFNTYVRGLLRIGGTFLGAVICTLLIVAFHPRGEVLAVVVVLFLYFAYCTMNVNYGAFAVAITVYIVFILAMVRSPERATIVHRSEATLIGGAVALAVHALFLMIDRMQGKDVRAG